MHPPRVLVFSKKNNLTNEIENLLLAKGCSVSLIESVGGESEKFAEKIFDYIIDFNALNPDPGKDLVIRSLVSKGNTKILFVFSYSETEKSFFENSLKIKNVLYAYKNFAGAIFLGEIIDEPLFSLTPNYFSGFILSYLTQKFPSLAFAESHVFYPLSCQEAARQTVRHLFSLKAYGKKTAIIGRPLGAKELVRFLKKTHFSKEIVFKDEQFINHEVDEKVVVKEDRRKVLRNFLALVKKRPPVLKTSREEKRFGFTHPRSVIFKNWKLKIIILLFTLSFLPGFFLTISLTSLFFAYKTFQGGYLEVAQSFLYASDSASYVSEKYNSLLLNIPYIKLLYLPFEKPTKIIKKETEIGTKFLSLAKNLNAFTDKITNDDSYDLSSVKDFSLELDSLYKDLAFLETEIRESDKLTREIATLPLSTQDLRILREKILLGSKIFSNLEVVLGKEKPQRFAIVIQDNRFLRATGGRIESLILLTFSNGKISNLEVLPVSFADKNLVGVVDPPLPLKKYFGVETWFLRDANWDPDFAATASTIAWFIDKELDERVDAVLALDYKITSQVLEILAKDQKERFERLQKNSGADEEYPAKSENSVANFLSTLVTNPKSLTATNRFKLTKILLIGLERKDIQIWLKNQKLMKLISELGWNGAVAKKECQGNCYSDLVSLIESTVEGDASLIEREYKYSVSLEEGLVKRKLFVFLENNSDVTYSFYVRLLTPSDAGFSPVEIITNDSEEARPPDVAALRNLKEAGVFEEIAVKKAKALLFSWESAANVDYKNQGEYKLVIAKQAGIKDFPLEVEMKFPENLNFSATQPFILTARGNLVYNTLVSRDFVSRIFWQEK